MLLVLQAECCSEKNVFQVCAILYSTRNAFEGKFPEELQRLKGYPRDLQWTLFDLAHSRASGIQF